VALYVFCKSWSSKDDKRLLAAAILLFILGVFKCFEKPFALKRASFTNIVSSFRPSPRTKSAIREVELEEYIQEGRYFVQRNMDPTTLDLDRVMKQLSIPDKLFVDFAYSYPDRLAKLKSFWPIADQEAYSVLRRLLSNTFDLIYSKVWQGDDQNRTVSDSNFYSVVIWLLTQILPIVPIVLFHTSHKEAYKESDIKVTFMLLYITYLLEVSSLFIWVLFGYIWPDLVAQHSLVGFLARNKRYTRLMAIAECLQCKGLFDQYNFLEPCYSSKSITKLVYGHVKDGWLNYIKDTESYWKFSDIRGQWTLERNGCKDILGGSVEKPFDESVILWHVATDFCFHLKRASSNLELATLCRDISNYMMHLLFANPEMLISGSRRVLYTTAYNDLEAILEGDDLSLLDETGIMQKVVDRVGLKEGFVHDSWVLSQELMRLGDEQRMWDVIKGVWVEMLCFSAGRCRGYLHAKSLGSGGEYLSFVSLLMSHAGLETFPERQQRVQLRVPKEARLHMVRVKAMKKEIERAAARNEVAGSSAEIKVVVS
jgi:hypothetical protein